MRIRSIILGAAALLAVVGAAWAVQPGTDGTEKRFQSQGLRSAVLLQPNLTAASVSGADPSSSAATLNGAGSGIITTPSLVTPAASDHVLTLTNNMIAAGDLVFATVQKGSATVGSFIVSEIAPAAGSVVIKVRNTTGGTTADGTYKIGFFVVKQNANGSD